MMDALGTGHGLFLTAAVLGVTHGFEPDHAAGISALTDDADHWTHAAFVGGAFAVGHVVIVLAWVGVLAGVGRGVASTTPAFERFGSVVSGVVLLVGAGALALRGARRIHTPSPSGFTAADGGAAGGIGGMFDLAHGHLDHTHDSRSAYLRTGVLGSLFSLSPPVSMLALVSTVVPTAGSEGAAGAVAVYAVSITLTMAAIGGSIGELFALVRGRGRRVHAALELVTSAFVLWFAVTLLL